MKKIIMSLLLLTQFAEAQIIEYKKCGPLPRANHSNFASYEAKIEHFNGTFSAVFSVHNGTDLKLFTQAQITNVYTHGFIYSVVDSHPNDQEKGYKLKIDIASFQNSNKNTLTNKETGEEFDLQCN